MDAIEQAIRNAFSKGDPEDPAFRERVYRSASAALEKAIGANAAITPEAAERRRSGLLATVTSIESEFVPAVEAVTAPAAASSAPMVEPDRDLPASAAPEVDVAPARREPAATFHDAPAPSAEWPAGSAPEAERPVLAGEARPAVVEKAIADEAPRRGSGRRWGLLAGLVTFVVIVALAIWIGVEAGYVNLPGAQRPDPAVTAQPPSESDGAPRKPGEQEALENWIVVFSPDDPTTVAAAVGARAEVVDANGEQAIQISSGKDGAPIRFDVGQGVLERIAGKSAVFDIVATTGDGPETQISVSCDFGPLGDCGRNRYVANTQRGEFLLQVDIPAGQPSGNGTIEIQSDLSNEGKSVQIIQIRVNTP